MTNEPAPISEYLVISRGKWDRNAPKDQVEAAIDKFYAWLERNIELGRMKTGSRLTMEAARVSKSGYSTDGPFGESKEVVGGFWFIRARSLKEAAELAAESPCLQFGLHYEIRPLEAERGSIYRVTNETPND